LELKYNKFYIGLSRDGQPFNFVEFHPKKNFLTLEVKLPQTAEIDTRVEEAGLDAMDYENRWGHYRLRLTKPDLESKAAVIRELMQLAYNERVG
jgi:hypothetical protein